MQCVLWFVWLIQIDCFAAADARISEGTEFISRGAAGSSPIDNWVVRVEADPEEHEVRKRDAAKLGILVGKGTAAAYPKLAYPKHFVKCFLRGKIGAGIVKKLYPVLFGPFGKVMKVMSPVIVPPIWKAVGTTLCPHVALKHSIIFG